MMTYDPREAKLPKWAIDVLAEARLRGDLAWPTTDCPEPDVAFDANNRLVSGDRSQIKNRKAYHIVGGYSGFSVESVWFGDHNHIWSNAAMSGFGSRPYGPYWWSEQNAWIAAWWQEANAAAKKMHRIAQKARESKCAE
jgi:hypothetical protein